MTRAEQKSADWSGIGSVVSASAAVLALIVTLIVASLSNDAVRDAAFSAERTARESALRAERADAYATYVEVHTRFNEFVWAHHYHAGTDVEGTPGDDPKFWPTSVELMSQLESTNLRARMLAYDTDVEDLLIKMRQGEAEVFRKFKCMAGLVCSGPYIAPDENEAIGDLLEEWSSAATDDKDALIEAAAGQLQ